MAAGHVSENAPFTSEQLASKNIVIIVGINELKSSICDILPTLSKELIFSGYKVRLSVNISQVRKDVNVHY